MKRLTVLLAVLAASFTAILVAPAIASAGCVLTYNTSAPTYDTLFFGSPPSLQKIYKKPNAGTYVACGATNGNIYLVDGAMQVYTGGHWVWDDADPTLNQNGGYFRLVNTVMNSNYLLTCYDAAGNQPYALLRVPPACPAAYDHPSAYLYNACSTEAGPTLVRWVYDLKKFGSPTIHTLYATSSTAYHSNCQ